MIFIFCSKTYGEYNAYKNSRPDSYRTKKSGCDVSSIRIIDDIPEKLYEKRHVYFIDVAHQASSIEFSEGLREMTDIHIPDCINGFADRRVFIIQ